MIDQDIEQLETTDKIDMSHFTLLSVIGKGSYAKVSLVRKKNTLKIYALKAIKKESIKRRKQSLNIKTERTVLQELKHPFVVNLAYAFQNDKKLFFVLEYCPGGELFSLLQRKKSLSEESVKFYAAQIILGIQYLHSKNIIYRDLKPENVVIDSTGYIKITDFGLSKKGIEGNSGAFSVCGTPEYLAPEILQKNGHGKPVDWWTLGAIMYECFTGQPPFFSNNKDALFEKIKNSPVQYSNKMSPNFRSLLEGLFQKDPELRLSAQGIQSHPFFNGFKWNDLLDKKIKPPFIPNIKHETDVSCFDPEFTETEINSYQTDNNLRQSQNENEQYFEDFSYNQSNISPTYSDDLKIEEFKFQDNFNNKLQLNEEFNMNFQKY